MSVVVCKCGRTTNTATSNYWFTHGQGATECYVALGDDGKPTKGCAFDKAPEFMKGFAQRLLAVQLQDPAPKGKKS